MEYQTDKQIRDETDKLLTECLTWAKKEYEPLGSDFWRQVGITRFIYLKDKLLNHSPKYYREKELDNKGRGGTCEVKKV
jgi:hypothetical protein